MTGWFAFEMCTLMNQKLITSFILVFDVLLRYLMSCPAFDVLLRDLKRYNPGVIRSGTPLMSLGQKVECFRQTLHQQQYPLEEQ